MQLSAPGFFGRLVPERHRSRVELGPFTRRSARSWLPSRIRGFRYASERRPVFDIMTVNAVG
jgi:hypothetical protein